MSTKRSASQSTESSLALSIQVDHIIEYREYLLAAISIVHSALSSKIRLITLFQQMLCTIKEAANF